MMQRLRFTLTPTSAFGSPLRGDTLFGQLCWAARRRFGNDRLNALLQNYTKNQPFLIVSDGFPTGYIPRPDLPKSIAPAPQKEEGEDAKAFKKKRWLPRDSLNKTIKKSFEHAEDITLFTQSPQSHNSIRRDTNTTGEGDFAPYQLEQLWPEKDIRFDIYTIHDSDFLTQAELHQLLTDVGTHGYGRDGSIGLGKFAINSGEPDIFLPPSEKADAWLTLAPCTPQGGAWQSDRCFWRPFTRFGRHGDIAAVGKNAFKTPILLADTAAVFTPTQMTSTTLFIGKGLGGDGSLSATMPQTVHQGYAPVLPIQIGAVA